MSPTDEAKEKAKEKARMLATLAANMQYGTAIRRGKSGKIYTFKIGVKTQVDADDFKAFTDAKGEHYEKYLTEFKEEPAQ
ncbi:MAG: hypothetical protein KDE62_16780 [Calditrichaeota bacterium]|nr:hypothetical protein [Calditrichota bacterium]